MGVVYKLKPEIKNFILEQKKTKPILSCRSLTALVEAKFQIKVSKSSINSIFKEADLSSPVGRRRKKRRLRPQMPVAKPQAELKLLAAPVKAQIEVPLEIPPVEIPSEAVEVEEAECTGVILLRSADYLIGGSYSIAEAIRRRLNKQEDDLLAKIETLIYMPLFELAQEREIKDLCGLWALIDKRPSLENILLYLNDLQSVKTTNLDILRVLSSVLQEVRCVKVSLSDGSILYLDGKLYTVWSTPQIPNDFSTTIYNIKSYINKYFYEDRPFILFMAPGYDVPTKEFFDFILSFATQEKKVSGLTLYGHQFEEIEYVSLRQAKRRFFIFGLWPWQFIDYRKVKKIGEFKPFNFEALKKELYVADIEIELLQPDVKQSVTLKGYALKTSPTEKTCLIILSNLSPETDNPNELLKLYLNHWPNLEETFQDFSHKVELFTYTGTPQSFLSMDKLGFSREEPPDLKTIFNCYLKALDLYVKRHFLPSGYEDKDFPTIKGRFYDLKAVLKKEKGDIGVTFQPPPGFQYLKELEYICRRLNEREIFLIEATRLRFSS